ncbi:M36 family metallopeptidase [Ulvibacter antarcticus]|uniref:Putative secreted protein (Por secretion system target) n=1 Tax=Ulvibacter antarcticus TaxID=442714 RepID=A0A3L9YXY6_9FLAO|nr:M36 family metallopeptidase [Ulvibacter antarcticus]RMA64690.1 putative secreted protein (Por secretion system target) [Ulvibacter antarcticus]
MVWKGLIVISLLLNFSVCTVIAQDTAQLSEEELWDQLQNFDLFSQDEQFNITSQHKSSTSGIRHFYLRQQFNGLDIFGTESSVHISSDDIVVYKDINFLTELPSEKVLATSRQLTAVEILERIANQLDYSITNKIEVVQQSLNSSSPIILSNAGISLRNIPCKKSYLWNNDELVLVWQMTIYEKSRQHWWNIFAAANTGKIIIQKDLIKKCSFSSEACKSGIANYDVPNYNAKPSEEKKINTSTNESGCSNCYEVFKLPIESPYYGQRTIVENPANTIASPYGWHDINGELGADFSNTTGNNINVFVRDASEAYQTDGGSLLNFTGYSFNEYYSLQDRSIDAALTNLFYCLNVVHDVSYIYGFDEAAGNFQYNNYGKGGLENDRVSVRTQLEFSGNCSATFGSPVDGEIPELSINTCDNRDGSFDSAVTIHEYGHGIVQRLWGGRTVTDCENPLEKLEEGYCDWYGLAFTMDAEDTSTMRRGIATFYRNLGSGSDGIRTYPYTTDINVNPHTYGDVEFSSLTHYQGSVWAEMLWEVTWKLISLYGYDADIYNFTGDVHLDAGNVMAFAIITESLKLIPCNAGFIEARNAIITANRSIYGGFSECFIWEAFAKRGLGYSAITGHERFDIPDTIATFDISQTLLCINDDNVYGLKGGTPFGGVYSGLGVIDDGNGLTFTFQPSLTGLGEHEIQYIVPETSCTQASSDSAILEVYFDTTPPIINCLEELIIQLEFGETFTIEDYTNSTNFPENCRETAQITQSIEPGTEVNQGARQIIMTATDSNNQTGSCIINLIIEVQYREGLDLRDIILMFPNPADDEMTILNLTSLKLTKGTILDVQGRLIENISFSSENHVNTYNVSDFQAGTYFVYIESESGDKLVLSLIKM